MAETRFIIGLTKHRFLGSVFLPFIIREQDTFFSVERQLTLRDLDDPDLDLQAYERELVTIIEKYSDERLMKRFSRAKNVSEFFAGMEKEYFERYISPFIDQCIFDAARILMLSPVRLFNKRVKYANLYAEDEIRVHALFGRPVFYFERTPEGTRYRLRIFQGEREIPLMKKDLKIVTNEPCLLVFRGQLVVFEKLDAKKLTPFFSKEYVSVSPAFEAKYYSGFVRKVVRDFDVRATGFEIRDEPPRKSASLTLEKNLNLDPCLILRFHYEDTAFFSGSKRSVVVNFYTEGKRYIFRKILRDYEWERGVQEKVLQSGLKEKNGSFILRGIELLDRTDALYHLVNWLNETKPELEAAGIRVKQGKLDKRYFTGKQHLEFKPALKEDWFDVYAVVRFGEYRIPFIRLKKYILNDIREFELPDGQVAVIPEEWLNRYKSLLPFAKSRGEHLQFGRSHYALVQHFLQPDDASIGEKLRQISGGAPNIRLPGGLQAALRSYQKEGFRWMYGLHRNGFGGCLADDMGLGKTLQTLALLLKLKRPDREPAAGASPGGGGQLSLFNDLSPAEKDQPASLIVVPTSLVYNWEAEIEKFAPGLKIYKHVGLQRKKAEALERAVSFFDVILTTYGIVRNDAEALSKMNFFYLILDESQYVKNPSSKTYKAVMKLKSAHRLVLTGTPIENSLSDLWSQMNFLNQGMLGNLAFFRRYFITPVQKYGNKDQMEKLQILIRPFILRRTKEEVARDLPPLMEQVVMCEMEKKQARIYEKEKSGIRNSILAEFDGAGPKKSAMVILQGLTRLRQLANHPRLLEDASGEESGKFGEVIRMLENVVSENHKVLVFSSFVKHLELLKTAIEQNNWKYSMLTGQTADRKKVISRFQEEADNCIFLISLKAGGVGLNLTGADYVFIIDPWWNPAAENQAVSRAHRIGQQKHVFVYRFITENSIEEKIQQLKNRKSRLANKFINSNDPLKEITREEIMNLLK